jgi:release factor glutamine methyltransferase
LNLSQLIARVAEELASSGIESHTFEAREIIAHQLKISKAELSMLELQESSVSEDDLQKISNLSSERAKRVPLQHLIGKSYFRNLELDVGPGVFIPRPETETLVEIALGLELPERSLFEVGAGSGAISISLSEESDFDATAIEISGDSARWTRKNIENYGNQVELIVGDFEDHMPIRKYGLLISNPPYIPSQAIPVDPEVNLHDPAEALYSGEDGLDLIRLLAESKNYLHTGGVLLFEHDESQRVEIVELLLEKDWRGIQSFKDLNGRDRFIQAVA